MVGQRPNSFRQKQSGVSYFYTNNIIYFFTKANPFDFASIGMTFALLGKYSQTDPFSRAKGHFDCASEKIPLILGSISTHLS